MALRPKQFVLTEEHITLLRGSYVDRELSDIEYGAAQIDPKRPYGNSDVESDLAWILGVELVDGEHLRQEDRERIVKLHQETPTALQIVLATGSFQPGTYEAAPYGIDWKLVDA